MTAVLLVAALLTTVAVVCPRRRFVAVLAAVAVFLSPLAGVVPASANMHTDRVTVGA